MSKANATPEEALMGIRPSVRHQSERGLKPTLAYLSVYPENSTHRLFLANGSAQTRHRGDPFRRFMSVWLISVEDVPLV